MLPIVLSRHSVPSGQISIDYRNTEICPNCGRGVFLGNRKACQCYGCGSAVTKKSQGPRKTAQADLQKPAMKYLQILLSNDIVNSRFAKYVCETEMELTWDIYLSKMKASSPRSLKMIREAEKKYNKNIEMISKTSRKVVDQNFIEEITGDKLKELFPWKKRFGYEPLKGIRLIIYSENIQGFRDGAYLFESPQEYLFACGPDFYGLDILGQTPWLHISWFGLSDIGKPLITAAMEIVSGTKSFSPDKEDIANLIITACKNSGEDPESTCIKFLSGKTDLLFQVLEKQIGELKSAMLFYMAPFKINPKRNENKGTLDRAFVFKSVF